MTTNDVPARKDKKMNNYEFNNMIAAMSFNQKYTVPILTLLIIPLAAIFFLFHLKTINDQKIISEVIKYVKNDKYLDAEEKNELIDNYSKKSASQLLKEYGLTKAINKRTKK